MSDQTAPTGWAGLMKRNQYLRCGAYVIFGSAGLMIIKAAPWHDPGSLWDFVEQFTLNILGLVLIRKAVRFEP